MTVGEVTVQILSNVGVTPESFLLILAILVSILFAVANFQLGLIILMILNAVVYIVLVSLDFPSNSALMAWLVTGAIMALSLWTNFKQSTRGLR